MITHSHADVVFAHAYGAIHGVYIAIFSLLVLFGASYLSRNRGSAKVAKGLFMAAFSFLCFAFYNVFFEQAHHAVTADVFLPEVFVLAKFAAPIGLLIATTVFVRYIPPLSQKAFQVARQYKLIVSMLYALNICVLIALFFIDSPRLASLLILCNFVPHIIFTSYFGYVVFKSDYGLLVSSIYFMCLIVLCYFLWALVTGQPHLSQLSYLFVNTYFIAIVIMTGFIALRYGSAAAERLIYLESQDEHGLVHDIFNASKNDQFSLVYQPKIHLMTERICGFEAFIRWQHPKYGEIQPLEFIGLAEKTGHIDVITLWTIDRITKDIQALMKKKVHLPASLNLSPESLKPSVVQYLLSTLKKRGIPKELLVIEVSESTLMNASESVKQSLNMLHIAGVKLSLDNYSLGMSTLKDLQNLQISELKLDKNIVAELNHSTFNRAVAESIIRIAQHLNMMIVAEGVETPEVKHKLKQLGCKVVQGYVVAKPMALGVLMNYLVKQKVILPRPTKGMDLSNIIAIVD